MRGKIVAITGASSGIGHATALLLGNRGARLALGGRRLKVLETLAAEIVLAGGEAVAVAVDVTKRANVERMVTCAGERFGGLDVFISNAGIGPISKFDALCVEDWESMVDVNLKGVLYGIAASLPVFRRQGSGHFINVISTAGLRIVPGQGVYAATKNAVRTITEALRQEAGPNLRVTGISPGFVRTEFAESMTDPAAKAAIVKRMDEIAISPDAIAGANAFAIEQPDDVDIGDIVIRPTAQD